MKVVIDTNVLLVANGKHDDASEDCVEACVKRLQAARESRVVVIDDEYRILGEYQHKAHLNPARHAGDAFLKWLLQNKSNPQRVRQVRLTETATNEFAEFPGAALQQQFDPSDRKFAAVSHADPDKPPIWQASDSKWLLWRQDLESCGVKVEFLCPADVQRVYASKFPDRPLPSLPPARD